jgi:predicted DNA-binding transcriptional regulator YafY
MYHPTGRVLTVLELLQSRPGLTGAEIASRLETDVRTVRRYIMKLQDVGIPVEARAGRIGGYSLRPGYKLPPLIFSEPEATAIVLGLLANSWLEIEQSSSAVEGALSKITRVLPEDARNRVRAMSSAMFFSPYPDASRPDSSLLMLLSDAIQARKCVLMRYRAESGQLSKRIVEPYGLVGRRGKWYLVGFCRLRADYRTFRMDRIRKVFILDQGFKRDESFDFRAYAMKHLESYPVNWRLRVVFKATRAKVRATINPSLGAFTETPAGILFEWPIDDLDYGARYLLERGLPFVVRDPPEFKEVLRRFSEEIKAIADEG